MTTTVSESAGAIARSGRPGRPDMRKRKSARTGRQGLIAWLFALPFVLVFLVFMAIPLLASFAMSFTDFTARDVQSPLDVSVVGFDQYVALFSDTRFLKSLGVTGTFVLFGIPITIAIALLLAVALNNGIRHLKAFYRALFYVPVVTSIVAVSVVWRYLLQNDGLVNSTLAWFGIQGPNWLHDTQWALPALIVMATWRNVGTLMVIFIAGLQSVPEELYEAGELDGAGTFRKFWSITLPLLRPTLLLGAVLISVGYLQFFEESFVMTQGGPLDSTLSTAYYIYEKFGFGNYGLASAASYVLFVVIAIASLFQFRALRSKD